MVYYILVPIAVLTALRWRSLGCAPPYCYRVDVCVIVTLNNKETIMTTFTFEDYEFEGRQSETSNIVWLAGKPENSWSMPRSFSFEQVADDFLVSNNYPM